MSKSVMAMVAHPDDIEFLFSGTLLQLAERGWNIHYMTISSGNCGSLTMDAERTRMTRRGEAERAAKLSNHKSYQILDTLAVAYAAAGRFKRASRTAQAALELATKAHDDDAQRIRMRLELYQNNQPYREPRQLENY